MNEKLTITPAMGLTNALWRTIARQAERNESAPASFRSLMGRLLKAQDKGSVCIEHLPDEFPIDDLSELIQLGVVVSRKDVPYVDENNGSKAPIVFDDQEKGTSRFYLRRAFKEEWRLAKRLLAFANQSPIVVTDTQKAKLETLRQEDNPEQGLAIECSLPRCLSIICGGPGTGKTTTVAKLLECLLAAKPKATIALAAPTGKATSRMKESIGNSLRSNQGAFPLLQEADGAHRMTARTIHRWLQTPTTQGEKPCVGNPIEADILIVDEASMIDSTIALRLFEAVDPLRTRMILLGDRFQLAAVGPGSFFGELTTEGGPLEQCVSRLTKSFRFTSDSMIGQLAKRINTNGDSFDWHEFQKVFGESNKDKTSLVTNIRFDTIQTWLKPSLDEMISLIDVLMKADGEEFLAYRTQLWQCVSPFRVLCGNREGDNSVDVVNDWVENEIREALNIPQDQSFYPGKMVIIRTNNEDIGLYNGDVGIVVPHPENHELLEAIFDEEGTKHLSTGLLPQFDTAFAMTIHQSQGSEFDRVAVLLPVESESPLSTRELFYTGVTRAKKEVFIVATKETVHNACVHATSRESGLTERLLESR